MSNIDEPREAPYSQEYRQGSQDEPERMEPTFHRYEMVGRTARGRPRHVRVDSIGRLVISPDSSIHDLMDRHYKLHEDTLEALNAILEALS